MSKVYLVYGGWDYEGGMPIKCFSDEKSAQDWVIVLEKYDYKIKFIDDRKEYVKMEQNHPAGSYFGFDSYLIYELEMDERGDL